MGIGITITILGKGLDFYLGQNTGKVKLFSLSTTIFTIGIEFAVKV